MWARYSPPKYDMGMKGRFGLFCEDSHSKMENQWGNWLTQVDLENGC